MLNPTYTNPDSIRHMRAVFHQEKIIQLHKFLQPQAYKNFQDHLKKIPYTKIYNPAFSSYHTAPFPSSSFLTTLTPFFQDLAGTSLTLDNARILRFRQKDYTLLHDTLHEKKGITALLDFTSAWNPRFGGYHIYVQEQRELFHITPHPNTLTFLTTTAAMRSYIKYINHLARTRTHLFLHITYNQS